MSYDRTTKQTDRQRLLLFMISLYILYIYIDILREIVLPFGINFGGRFMVINIFKNQCFQNKCDKIKSIFNDIKNSNNNAYCNPLNLSLIYDNRDMFTLKLTTAQN